MTAPHFVRALLEEFNLGRWISDAACKPRTGHLFFPESGQTSDKAKEICQVCPVITQCAEYAITSPTMLRGVWGGMSEKELEKARRRTPKAKKVAVCGTPAGARAHYRKPEVPCAACRRAAAIERARWRETQRLKAL